MELVSVIVPVYNVEKYITQCIESLIEQTYKNIELILIDDGSTDDSGNICDYYLEKDNRIKVIHKENQGLGFARNTGLEHISGKYVTFVDSDDYVEFDMVEKLVEGIHKYGADTCIGGFKRVDNDAQEKYREQYAAKFYSGNKVYTELLFRMLGSAPDKQDAIRMSVWNVLYSVDIIEKNNIRFPSERVFISEDIIWDMEYYQYAKNVQIVDTVTYNYRIVPNSLTQKYRANRFPMVTTLYLELERRISAKGEYKEAVYRAQRQFFINLKACISQEKKIVSGKRRKESIAKIKEMCQDAVVVRIMQEYPIAQIGFKQRIFLRCVQHRCSLLLYLFACMNVI